MDLGISFTPADAGAGHPILMHGTVLSYKLRGTMSLDHAWNITGLWGVSLLNSRGKLLAELFPDLNQEYNDWHLTSTDSLQAFREQREDADPDADLKIWQLDGALLSTPAMEANQSNSRPLPPVWPFLDDPVAETLHLLNLKEFTELLNGCAPDVIVRHSFAIRYLHARTPQGA